MSLTTFSSCLWFILSILLLQKRKKKQRKQKGERKSSEIEACIERERKRESNIPPLKCSSPEVSPISVTCYTLRTFTLPFSLSPSSSLPFLYNITIKFASSECSYLPQTSSQGYSFVDIKVRTSVGGEFGWCCISSAPSRQNSKWYRSVGCFQSCRICFQSCGSERRIGRKALGM